MTTMTRLLLFIAACDFCSSNELHEGETCNCTGLLPNFAVPHGVQRFHAQGPNPQHSRYIRQVPHLFAERPIPDTFSGSPLLGQLSQHIQQGIASHYTGHSPFGQQIFNQFAGVLGQNPGEQFYTPHVPPGGPASLIGALTSIAMHDDLRCVPRLLCEIAAGGRPGYSVSNQRDSVLPFVNSDTLRTLLTLLNYGNTSPLMVFGSAVLQGITAKGDPNTCFSAYPTCPRDPDRLVDYLNNHNGGFFRFFGTQQPYNTPHHVSRIQTGLSQFTATRRPQDIRGNRPHQFPNHISTSLKPPSPPAYRDPDFFRQQTTTSKLSLRFPITGNNRQTKGLTLSNPNGTENSAVKTFAFPHGQDPNQDLHVERPPLKQTKPTVPMTFPDKTGTGDLRLDINDVQAPVMSTLTFTDFGNHNGVKTNKTGTLKFPLDKVKESAIKFPTTYHENSVDNVGYRKQATSLKFPLRDDTERFHEARNK